MTRLASPTREDGTPPLTAGPRAPEARSVAAVALTVLLLNGVGWGVLLLVIVPAGITGADGAVFGGGIGVTAFLLGVRHAFDADHITAIDNTTRKLVGDGRPAATVGLWFSLGHSSVVFALALLLAVGLRTLAAPLVHGTGPLPQILALGSAGVAAAFLLLLGLVNLGALRGLVSLARRARTDGVDAADLERRLAARGLLARLLRGILAKVARAAHIYPVGVLMGLGFDTASQVVLLVLAGGAATSGLPWYAILVLPVLFAAGMTLFDGADGVLMAGAYRWAFTTPQRRLRYNIAVTGVSVVAAFLVATVLAVDAAGQVTGASAVTGWLAHLDLRLVGAVLVAAFGGTWALAALTARRRRAS